MAIGKASDFKIHDEQVQGGFIETLVQNTQAFNLASRGAIRVISNRLPGHYDYEAFFKNISGLVSRRDITATTAVNDSALTQDEMVSVKLNRRIGPVAQTLDAFRKVGAQSDLDGISYLIGAQVAKAVQADQLNAGLKAAVAAIGAQTDLVHTASTTITTADLVDGLARMGDASGGVVAWVMHSKVFFDLVKEQIALKVTNVSDVNIAEATPVTLNRPVIVTDSASLVTVGSPSAYHTLGLVGSGIVIQDSEEEAIHAELVTGLENLVVRIQGEFAYNLGLRGCKWDVANGGVNPNDAALGTGTNWDLAATSVKDLAGVRINSN